MSLNAQLHNGITDALGLRNFQLIATPMNFRFPTAAIGEIAPQAYQIVSRCVPYSPLGQYAAGDASFFDAYREVLTHVTYKMSADKERDLNALKDQVVKAQNDVTKATGDMNQAFLAARQNGGIAFKKMYGDDGSAWFDPGKPGEAHQKGIEKLQATLTQKQDMLFDMQKLFMPDTLKNAVAIMKMPPDDPAQALTAPRGWTKVKNGAGILEWQPDYMIGTSGDDFRVQLAGGSVGKFSASLSNRAADVTIKDSWAHASTTAAGFFWIARASTTWSKHEQMAADKSVEVQLSVDASTRVAVNPGAWYDGGFLRALAKGQQASGDGYVISQPWVANGPKNSLFGPSGLLGTRINELLLVVRPKMTVKMSAATMKYTREVLAAGGGLCVGPFCFGGYGASTKQDFSMTTTNDTMTLESTSEDPVIIGVTVSFPGLDGGPA